MHTIKLSWEGFLFALFNSIFVRLFERQLQKLALKPMTYLAFYLIVRINSHTLDSAVHFYCCFLFLTYKVSKGYSITSQKRRLFYVRCFHNSYVDMIKVFSLRNRDFE